MTDQTARPAMTMREIRDALGHAAPSPMTDRIPLDHLTSDALDALYDRVAELEQVARGYCPHCGRGDAAPTVEDWDRERKRAKQAEAAVLREADWIVEHCPDHGCVEPETDVCHCEIADRLRLMADEPQQPTATEADSPRCLCGDPIQLRDEIDPNSWVHSPGSDTHCLDARPA